MVARRERAHCHWLVPSTDYDRARELAAALGISPLGAQLLVNRGFGEVEAARRFLDPRLSELRRPDGEQPMLGFAQAVDRLDAALRVGELVGVFGDYDVDGVTSAAVMTSFIRQAGGRAVARAAQRLAGYGFRVADVEEFAARGATLVVTCDLGTSDHEALAAARARGIDVIVVDHHQVPDREPEALALLNPHQAGCRFPFKGLASVGVAFYLAAALRTRLRERGATQVPDPRPLLGLVALGTIADLAPLTDENRILVSAGLRELGRSAPVGLRALMNVAGLREGVRRSSDVAMRLGPRLNAPGRLGEAQLALDLLLCDEPAEALALADACEQANRNRQEIQERVVRQALAEVERQEAAGGVRPGLVVAKEGWHPGVVGIVAAKLVDRYQRPAVVIAIEDGVGRGSARSTGGFHLVQALKSCAELLVRYGGHAQAAGLTIDQANLEAFALRFAAQAEAALGAERQRELHLDAEIPLESVDEQLATELALFEPFGMGNPEPCFGARGLTLEQTRVVGQTHLQVTLRDGLHACDGIGFHMAEGAPRPGARVRAAFFPEIDTFRGARRVRVRLRDLAPERI